MNVNPPFHASESIFSDLYPPRRGLGARRWLHQSRERPHHATTSLHCDGWGPFQGYPNSVLLHEEKSICGQPPKLPQLSSPLEWNEDGAGQNKASEAVCEYSRANVFLVGFERGSLAKLASFSYGAVERDNGLDWFDKMADRTVLNCKIVSYVDISDCSVVLLCWPKLWLDHRDVHCTFAHLSNPSLIFEVISEALHLSEINLFISMCP